MDMKVRKATEKKSTDILSWIDCAAKYKVNLAHVRVRACAVVRVRVRVRVRDCACVHPACPRSGRTGCPS
jgi:hypothetical protein